MPAQFLDSEARILMCGSFSKSAAPGYRMGWIVAGDDIDHIARLKRAYSCSSGLLQQLTLADFMASGDYERHLKNLRPELHLARQPVLAPWRLPQLPAPELQAPVV